MVVEMCELPIDESVCVISLKEYEALLDKVATISLPKPLDESTCLISLKSFEGLVSENADLKQRNAQKEKEILSLRKSLNKAELKLKQKDHLLKAIVQKAEKQQHEVMKHANDAKLSEVEMLKAKAKNVDDVKLLKVEMLKAKAKNADDKKDLLNEMLKLQANLKTEKKKLQKLEIANINLKAKLDVLLKEQEGVRAFQAGPDLLSQYGPAWSTEIFSTEEANPMNLSVVQNEIHQANKYDFYNDEKGFVLLNGTTYFTESYREEILKLDDVESGELQRRFY